MPVVPSTPCSVCLLSTPRAWVYTRASGRARARGFSSRVAASGHEMRSLSFDWTPAGALWRHVRRVNSGSLRLAWHCLLRPELDLSVRACERMYIHQRVRTDVFRMHPYMHVCVCVYVCLSPCLHVHVCMRVCTVSVHCGSVRRLETRWVQCPRELDAAPPHA
jgi:hypothetical protein